MPYCNMGFSGVQGVFLLAFDHLENDRNLFPELGSNKK